MLGFLSVKEMRQQATLSSLPDEVVITVGITSLPSKDSVSKKRRKLEFLEMQEELIKEEEEREGAEQARKEREDFLRLVNKECI